MNRSARAAAVLLTFALSLPTAPFFAAPSVSGTIQGRLLSRATQEYLRNVEVAVAGTNLAVFTGDDGYFTIGGVPRASANSSYFTPDTRPRPRDSTSRPAPPPCATSNSRSPGPKPPAARIRS